MIDFIQAQPETLHLLRELPGDAPVEAWLHNQFSSLRVRGEWFDFPDAKLTAAVSDDLNPQLDRIDTKRRPARSARLPFSDSLFLPEPVAGLTTSPAAFFSQPGVAA